MSIEDIDNMSSFVENPTDDVIIKVIGVGGGGDNAVNNMYLQGVKKVSFVVCNTDRQALNNSVVPHKLLIGPNTTKGHGAGNQPERAREAAEESAEEIKALFNDETRMVFITAGMGGGTGTGAAPVVARIAKERGLLTIGIVTIPFFFEGQKKILKALDGAEEMSKHVDALLLVNNEKLTEIYPDLTLINAFGKADDTLTNAARSISELITTNGILNLDFEDVNTTLSDGGAAMISTGYGEGDHRVTKAIEDALSSPLLKNKDIAQSKRLLFNIYFSDEADQEFVMGETNELNEFVSNINPDVDIIYGVGVDKSLGNKVKMTILAAGFPLAIKETLAKQNNKAKAGFPDILGLQGKRREATPPAEENPLDTLKTIYGQEKVETMQRARASVRYIIMRPDQFDDDSVIEIFEHNPTYTREKRVADEVRNNSPRTSPYAPSDRQTAASVADTMPYSTQAPAQAPERQQQPQPQQRTDYRPSSPDTGSRRSNIIEF